VLAPCPLGARAKTPGLSVAQIFRAHGSEYRQNHIVGQTERKAMWAIENCRTETLGGHLDVCSSCGDSRPSYNSCRNRHCPTCQNLAQAAWLEKRKARILPTHYFHVVFTMPAELRGLCRRNPEAMYNLLFAATSETLLDFGRSELGAQLGITAVLHTWTRDLRFHPHLHCVVTGGGLDLDNGRWVATSKTFLFSVTALAKRFRGKLLAKLRSLRDSGALAFDGPCAELADSREFGRLIDALYRTAWVVYAKPPFAGPEAVFSYLGRYTHRVGISNHRLLAISDQQICFRTRDGKVAQLTPEQFIGRFLLHILPFQFFKIRHYGLWAAVNAKTRLELARTRLPAATRAAPPATPSAPSADVLPLDWRERLLALCGIDLLTCELCGGRRIRYPLGHPSRSRPGPSTPFPDSS
jgi:hypothetical protein